MPKPPLRVLVICSHPVQYMAPLLRRMAKNDELDLCTVYCSLKLADAAYDSEFDATIKWDIPLLDGYRWLEIPNRGSGSDSFFGLCNPGIWKLIRNGQFHAIVCHTGYIRATFWIAFFAARMVGSAFIFGTDANTLVPRDARNWKVLVKKILWPRLYSLADQIIVPSSATRRLMRSLGISEDRITLTPYSVDNDWWRDQSAQVDKAAIRRSWNVNSKDLVILFCAKLQPWKRPQDLLQAFALAAVPNACLVFAGEGPLRSVLEAEAQALGLAARVRFLGFANQSQLPSIYSASDLMVLPSEYEPFAVVVNEAYCCGCPVIVSDRVGAGEDLVKPVNWSFIYPCGDVVRLAELLKVTLADRDSLSNWGRAAQKRMETWSIRENVSAAVGAIRLAVSHRNRR
jgi:glycosyltransferase involved in cell wall biosynthesis